MIHSKPKSNTLFAVGIFLLIVFAVDIWFLLTLINNPENYFFWKLLLIPTLLVIALIVGSKTYFASAQISLGKDRLTYRYPLQTGKTFKISAISSWKEEIIKRKSSTFKHLTIKMKHGTRLRISNHENTEYDKVVMYLKKKVKELND